MEKQKFISVWKEGEHWFDSPEVNYQEVEDMLVKKGISAKCVILPQGETPKAPKVKVITQKK